MLTNGQLKGIQLKAKIISDLVSDKPLNIEEIKEMFIMENVLSESAQVDELFKMLLDTIKGSSKQMPKNIDIKEIFKQLCPEDNDYSDFLFGFLNFLVNDSPDVEIQFRLNQLKELKYANVPSGCEAYKLYLYSVLTLALVCHPLDMDFINKVNEELMLINDENE